MKIRLLITLFLALAWTVTHAQGVVYEAHKADSLKKVIPRLQGISKAEALVELARQYSKPQLDSSRLLFEEALFICREAKDDTTLVKLICRFAPTLSDVGEQDLARHYLVLARELKSSGALLPQFRVKIYKELFDLHYWHLTNYDSCIYYSQKWIEIAPDSANKAWGYIELGVSYNELGDHIRALENYNTARAFLSSPGADLWMLAHVNNNLGMLYSDERELDKAEEYFIEALNYAQASKVPGADLFELNNLGLLYNWQGKYDQSLKYLEMAAQRLPLRPDAWAEANNFLNIGHTLTLAGRPREGLIKFDQAMTRFSTLKDYYKVAALRLRIAEAHRLLKNFKEAEKETLQSLAWDTKNGYGDLVKDSYEELFKIYGATKQFDKAFHYQSKYLAILDSLNSVEHRTKFGLMEKNFEIAQQELEREKLLRENEFHQAQARADRLTQISLGVGTLVLAIAVVLTLMAYRRSRIQNQKIEDQAKQLRDAADTKARFFANVSHELRTPVTLLNGMLELMQESPSREGTSRQMEIAVDSSRRLQRMLNDVLDLSRVEGGKWKLVTKRREMLPLLNRIVFAFESLMVKKNLKLSYEAASLAGATMMVDEDKFEKIINNLIYNAIKFNREGGWIKVTGMTSHNSIIIEVADSGMGIPETELPYVFDRFYQSSSTGKLNAQGIGIGLSLVREFTQLHGGEVKVTSTLNEGSRFTVELPIKSEGVSESEVTEDLSDNEAEITFDIGTRKPLVLVVEDNDEMRFYLREILGEHMEIAEAHHGREGLTWLKTHRPDLIISDVMMPEMDGYEFLKLLKNSDSYRGIPVVMLTARAAEEDLLQGLSLGVDDYMIKPFNAKELKIRIRNLLVNQEIRKEWARKPEENEVSVVSPAVDQVFLNKVKQFVEDNAGNSVLGVGELCEEMAMSERQLYRKAAALTGMTPAQLIKEIRLRLAHRLLLERQVVKVAELAQRVGFDNVSYFSKQFMERYGKRPAEML